VATAAGNPWSDKALPDARGQDHRRRTAGRARVEHSEENHRVRAVPHEMGHMWQEAAQALFQVVDHASCSSPTRPHRRFHDLPKNLGFGGQVEQW
jgi:hypothetical protein